MHKATREGFAAGLVELAANPNVVVLDADLAAATKSEAFRKVCPERFFDMGIAEGDMIGTAAGLATCGKIPFAASFAMFSMGRAFEQVRQSVCYANLNVTVVGTHAGPSCGEDGGTHQCMEDISLARSLPNMTVVVPADDVEAKAATIAAADFVGPLYLRMARLASPTIHDEATYEFHLGEGEVLYEGSDLAIIACGMMVPQALIACDQLAGQGIDATVINMHTIKPLDEELVIRWARRTGRVITVEEGSIVGGLGSAVAEVLAENCPARLRRIGINDEFGRSGNGSELLDHYGLNAAHIVEVAKELMT